MSAAPKVFALDARPHASNQAGRGATSATPERSAEVFARIPRDASVTVAPGISAEASASDPQDEFPVNVIEPFSIRDAARKNLEAPTLVAPPLPHSKVAQEYVNQHVHVRSHAQLQVSSNADVKCLSEFSDVSSLVDSIRQDISAHKEQQTYSLSKLMLRQEEHWQKSGVLETSVLHLRKSLAAHEEQQELHGVLVQDTIRDMQQQRASVTYLRTEHDRLHRCFEDLAKATKTSQCEVAAQSERHDEFRSALAATRSHLLTEQQEHAGELQKLRHAQREHQEQLRITMAGAHERVSALQAEHQEHATALRQLLEAQQELESSQINKPQSPGSSWEAIWRQELELLRAEQQAALADQVRLLKREFESAYRAEQLAEAATTRQVALERGMVEVKQKMDSLMMSYAEMSSSEARQLEDIGRRLASVELETDSGNPGTLQRSALLAYPASARADWEGSAIDATSSCIAPAAASCENSAEVISELRAHLDSVAAAVAGQAEKLDRVEHHHSQLAEALEENQCVARSLESQSSVCHESVMQLRAGLLQGMTNTDNSRELEERCLISTEAVQAVRAECMTFAREIAAQREAMANSKARAKDESLKLGKSHESLAQEVADIGCFVSERCEAFQRSLVSEAEARVCEQSAFRDEFTSAIAVITTQFDQWMDVITGMKAEISELVNSVRTERESRIRESGECRTELAAVVQTAYRELSRCKVDHSSMARPDSPCSVPEAAGGLDAELCTQPAGMASESGLAEWLHNAADGGAVNTAMICKLVLEVFNHCDRLSSQCASDCMECRLESRTAMERVDPAMRRLDEMRRDLEDDVAEFRKFSAAAHSLTDPSFSASATTGARADNVEVAVAAMQRELDAAIAGLNKRGECLLADVTQEFARLVSRVEGIEHRMTCIPEPASKGDTSRLEARRSVLKAMESMEAAAQRVAREAAEEEEEVETVRW